MSSAKKKTRWACVGTKIIAGWLRNRTGTANRNCRNRFSRNRKRNRNRRNRFPGTETGTSQLPYHPCKNGTHSTSFYSTMGHAPKTGTVRSVFPETEPEPPEPLSRNRNRNRNRPFLLDCAETQKTPFAMEPPEPKTGTARTVPHPNRNRTELNRGLPVIGALCSRYWGPFPLSTLRILLGFLTSKGCLKMFVLFLRHCKTRLEWSCSRSFSILRLFSALKVIS